MYVQLEGPPDAAAAMLREGAMIRHASPDGQRSPAAAPACTSGRLAQRVSDNEPGDDTAWTLR